MSDLTQYLAIVAYRCRVAGQPTDSLDFQVRWFEAGDADEVQGQIEAESPGTYANVDGETVTWELAEILAIELFTPPESGGEVVGFISSPGYLRKLTNAHA